MGGGENDSMVVLPSVALMISMTRPESWNFDESRTQ